MRLLILSITACALSLAQENHVSSESAKVIAIAQRDTRDAMLQGAAQVQQVQQRSFQMVQQAQQREAEAVAKAEKESRCKIDLKTVDCVQAKEITKQ